MFSVTIKGHPISIHRKSGNKALQEYNMEKSEGRLTSHEDLKKELGF